MNAKSADSLILFLGDFLEPRHERSYRVLLDLNHSPCVPSACMKTCEPCKVGTRHAFMEPPDIISMAQAARSAACLSFVNEATASLKA